VQRDDGFRFGADVNQEFIAVHPHNDPIDNVPSSVLLVRLGVVVEQVAHALAGRRGRIYPGRAFLLAVALINQLLAFNSRMLT